jgi:hypothetical protein
MLNNALPLLVRIGIVYILLMARAKVNGGFNIFLKQESARAVCRRL